MIATTRAPFSIRIAVCAALLACSVLMLLAGAASAAGVATYQPESFKTYEQQLASGQIQAVTVNKKLRSLRITLKDGSYALAKYGPKEEPKSVAALEAKHVPVTILTPTEAAKQVAKKPVHHKLRYIAGGIVVVVILIVGAVLYINRKRQSELE
jgi:cytochrome bd-type quinol oxidase subunit 1